MSPEQSRMARAALNLSAAQLASAAGVGYATVARFETGANVQSDKVQALRSALETAGVVFVGAGEASLAGGAGVRLRAGD